MPYTKESDPLKLQSLLNLRQGQQWPCLFVDKPAEIPYIRLKPKLSDSFIEIPLNLPARALFASLRPPHLSAHGGLDRPVRHLGFASGECRAGLAGRLASQWQAGPPLRKGEVIVA